MEEKKINIKFNIIAIVLIMLFCFAITPKTLQNDTFYTIKIGEYILENGITMEDPFSWHKGIDYTFPHWGYDVMIYLFYAIGGQTGVYISTIVFCMLLGIVLYLTNNKLNGSKVVSFVMTIGTLYLLQNYIAARAQLVTFILFVLTVYFIERFLDTGKKRFIVGLFIIPIMMANLHVAVFPFYFILYLPYIVEYMVYILAHTAIIINKSRIDSIYKKIQKTNDSEKINLLKSKLAKIEEANDKRVERRKKANDRAYKIIIKPSENIKVLIIIMIIAILTGLFTPLGDVPYTYLIDTMQGNTTQNISEHKPMVLKEHLDIAVVLIAFIAILMLTDTKIKLRDLFMLAGLIALTFYTRRQESMFAIVCVFILSRLIVSWCNKYAPELLNNLQKKSVTIIGEIILVTVILVCSWYEYKPKMDDPYISKASYPVEAAEWIKENLDVDNIRLYNEYNYGSYLLFQDIPVFIDSRADLYAPEFNDGVTVFTDFLTISGLNNSVKTILDKYDFTHYIIFKNSKLKLYLRLNPEEYREVYEDRRFCIYEKIGAMDE